MDDESIGTIAEMKSSNTSSSHQIPKGNGSNPCNGTVNDIELDKTYRLIILYLTITFCLIGSVLVVLWIILKQRISRKFNHHSRVNNFILNLTVADILVILLAVVPQLIWEYVDREWLAGDFMCRAVKFMQTFSMTASNYMLVVIAIDRQQAIISPLKEPYSVCKMAGLGWGTAVLLSLPVVGIFHTSEETNGFVKCENIFRGRPKFHRQIWMTWVAFVVFFAPLVLLTVCYTRIFMKISRKAFQHNSVKYIPSKGKVCLQSTHSNSLSKAKIKTLKMTCVIIASFILCTTPYFIVEMIMSYGDHCTISKKLYAILGGMAACNSATNPFVFLAFNLKGGMFKCFKQCINNSSRDGTLQSSHTGSTGANPQHCVSPANTSKYVLRRHDSVMSHEDMTLLKEGSIRGNV
ncbi:neuropeptide S receptor-like [Dreissena polymorpha]|uniref:G-protein coupled receptors family 1 profile domain-containing protein n=1 Tax=Dreissena polymorpha TaxID=45954 RepID=A0A9D4KJH2_DREPO|nr:neuropeptide S receptor-like [Dreissena polymorpha]KAH3840236.1 hypothetical protein DPMN_113683 [Dreissena polymorpha]